MIKSQLSSIKYQASIMKHQLTIIKQLPMIKYQWWSINLLWSLSSFKSRKVKSGQVKSVQIKSGQVKSRHIKSGQAQLGYWFCWDKSSWNSSIRVGQVRLLQSQSAWQHRSLKWSTFIIQKLASHKNGVEFRQQFNDAIWTSRAAQYDVERRRRKMKAHCQIDEVRHRARYLQ